MNRYADGLRFTAYMRARHMDGEEAPDLLEQVDLTRAQVEDMYHYIAIANYEDRFVIPSTHREYAENAFDLRSSCGFSFGNGCSGGASDTNLFGLKRPGNGKAIPIRAEH
ncbi:Respiratory nitrate reductase beta chain (EC 1.7.99.4) (plasmid) [Mycetohabitans rhizoxinica HKI 454]|uniref:Respiratory nitrate reductase beta chain n=1 Tax=Mycetohabitans rhizoxinica (strain DSM 19002 / CIP 109453 / HKI 454) TaxID=882378 RepID=E5AVP4_MYCRK|nr:Respiratory nitrate reductase beta chain (EC 1.7.99.4) [Mycetohabitans rhizoxinica HKI 454]